MAFDYINEAFKKLDILEEELFSSSVDGINKLNDFIDEDDNTEETIRVIDPEVESTEDLSDSYVGKVIVNCNVCHSHIFENKEDIVIEEDGAVNVDAQCPYCGESEGFTVVGEIAPFVVDSEDSVEEAPVEETPVEEEPADNTTLEEALGVGAGLALGGAAIGAGSVISKLVDDVNNDSEEEPLVEDNSVEEGLLGDINLSIDGSNSSVGFLGGTASTSNEALDADNNAPSMSRASKRVVQEDFKEVSITTDDQHLEMTSDENGKVTVTTEPISEETTAIEAETIVPVSDETTDEILANNDIEEPIDVVADESDFEFDDADESGFDELGENYFKRVYENVESFKTTEIMANDSHLIVEGLIKFNSGAQKKTGFIFEAKDVNSRGQLRFIGTNKHLTESADAFCLVGRIDNKKLFVESLKYNYAISDNTVRGIIRRK